MTIFKPICGCVGKRTTAMQGQQSGPSSPEDGKWTTWAVCRGSLWWVEVTKPSNCLAQPIDPTVWPSATRLAMGTVDLRRTVRLCPTLASCFQAVVRSSRNGAVTTCATVQSIQLFWLSVSRISTVRAGIKCLRSAPFYLGEELTQINPTHRDTHTHTLFGPSPLS